MKFKRIFPQDGHQLLDGGLNSKFEKSLIEDNESPDCKNVEFTNGAVGTRPGISKVNTAAVGSFVCDGLYTRHGSTSTQTMVGFWGGSAWEMATSTFSTISSAQSIFTAGIRVAGAEYENHIFFGNGGVIPYKYNGTDWTRHGVYPATTTMTAATAPTGTGLTGAYSYKMTFVNSQSAESDVNPVSNTLTAANENIRLTSIPVAPQSHGVSSRRLYRTAAGGSTYKRLATIADNTTTTYDDAIADASLGANAPTDNGVPTKYSAIIYHQDRLFFNDPSEPNMVKWTNLGEPYTHAVASNFKPVGDATADIVRGFAVDNNNLIVFCDRTITIAFMDSTAPADWKWVVSRSAYGSKSTFGSFRYNDKTGFPAMQANKFVGIAALSGDMVEPSVTSLETATVGSLMKSERIETDMFSVQESYVGNISSITFKNKAYISVTYSSGQTTNNRVYCLDFSLSNLKKRQQEAWAPLTGITAAQFTEYNGSLYYGDSLATGFVYQMLSATYTDVSTAIDSYFWTKEFSGLDQDTNMVKDHRFARILVDKAGAYNMNFTFRVDSDRGDGNTTVIDLDPGGSLWGVMEWGADTWGGGTHQEEVTIPLGGIRGKRIQFKFSNQNTAAQRFKVHRISYDYNIVGPR
jgi:hypothetical protein